MTRCHQKVLVCKVDIAFVFEGFGNCQFDFNVLISQVFGVFVKWFDVQFVKMLVRKRGVDVPIESFWGRLWNGFYALTGDYRMLVGY